MFYITSICEYKNPFPWKDKDLPREYIKDGDKEYIYCPTKPWINSLEEENDMKEQELRQRFAQGEFNNPLLIIEGEDSDK